MGNGNAGSMILGAALAVGAGAIGLWLGRSGPTSGPTSAPAGAAAVDTAVATSEERYLALVAVGWEKLDQGLAADALALALEARRLDSDRWEDGVLAASAAASEGKFEEARALLTQAAGRAPESKRSALDELQRSFDAAAQQRPMQEKAEALEREARAAEESNRQFLAAQKYAEAWGLDRRRPDLALRSAAAYTVVDSVLEASRLLKEVQVETRASADAKAKATAGLERLRPALLTRHDAARSRGTELLAARDWRGAVQAFAEAISFLPDVSQTHLSLARAHAAAGEAEQATAALQEAIRLGFLDRQALFVEAPELIALAEDPGLQQLLTEAFGPDMVRDMSRRAPDGSVLPDGIVHGRARGEFLNEKDGTVLVWVPAGKYLVGSDDGEPDERPSRTLGLEQGFFVGASEVTWAQYRAYCQATGAPVPDPPSFPVNDQHPVVNVTWSDARAYCQWAGLRLPDEFEWEIAARAGSQGDFCYGSGAGALGDYAWFDANAQKVTHPVREKRPNAWGLFDAHGNVWEWCETPYSRDTPGYTARVVRGGCIFDTPEGCRAADRFGLEPEKHGVNLGFRAAR